MSETTRITTLDGNKDFMAYVARPEGTPRAAIVVIQEIFGINAGIRRKCDKLAEEGYDVVLADTAGRLHNKKDLVDELKKIHGEVVASYSEAVIAFTVFIDGLNEDNVESRYKALLSAMDKVGAAEKAYHRNLREYYARSRVRLVDSKKP